MDRAHSLLAAVVGSISLAIVRRRATRQQLQSWASTCEDVARMFRGQAGC